MSQVCPRYVPDMSKIGPRYMSQICQNISQICPRYAQDMPGIIHHLSFVIKYFTICPSLDKGGMSWTSQAAWQPTDQPTKQPSKYIAYPDLFNLFAGLEDPGKSGVRQYPVVLLWGPTCRARYGELYKVQTEPGAAIPAELNCPQSEMVKTLLPLVPHTKKP